MKRDYKTIYKQTILGLIWLFLSKFIIIFFVYVIIFNKIAKISTDEVPPHFVLFIWNYFMELLL